MTVKSIAKKVVRRCGFELVRRVTTVDHIHPAPFLNRIDYTDRLAIKA